MCIKVPSVLLVVSKAERRPKAEQQASSCAVLWEARTIRRSTASERSTHAGQKHEMETPGEDEDDLQSAKK